MIQKRFVAGLFTGIMMLGTMAGLTWTQGGGEKEPGAPPRISQPPAFPGIGGPGGFPLQRDFEQIDQNHDGLLSKEEIAGWFWTRLSQADANQDQLLSRAELDRSLPPEEMNRGPGRGRGFGPGGFLSPRGEASGFLTSPPLPADDREKQILTVLDDMESNQRGGMMNVPRDDGRLLRLLAESLNAQTVVELGTSNGYSGIWFCLGLRKTGGKLKTFEIDAQRAALARENFTRAGVDGLVTLFEGDAHQRVKELNDPIDLLFLDADKEGYLDYLNQLLPLIRPGGLIVAHNINAQMADPAFIQAITTNPVLDTTFLNIRGSGISVTLKKM
ncbi:MAG TPA: O-methyltransferase [bacterium]|nr:O-methyltransferase [bacterium]HOL95341.1 O-methyltransferase [bacterium]HPP02643.1 O-methyltransferase [bacterium]